MTPSKESLERAREIASKVIREWEPDYTSDTGRPSADGWNYLNILIRDNVAAALDEARVHINDAPTGLVDETAKRVHGLPRQYDPCTAAFRDGARWALSKVSNLNAHEKTHINDLLCIEELEERGRRVGRGAGISGRTKEKRWHLQSRPRGL